MDKYNIIRGGSWVAAMRLPHSSYRRLGITCRARSYLGFRICVRKVKYV